jgi:hypothetical protein
MSASFSTTALISASVIRVRVLLAVLLGCPAPAGLKARLLGFGLGDPAGHCCRACAGVAGSPVLVQFAVALGDSPRDLLAVGASVHDGGDLVGRVSRITG